MDTEDTEDTEVTVATEDMAMAMVVTEVATEVTAMAMDTMVKQFNIIIISSFCNCYCYRKVKIN